MGKVQTSVTADLRPATGDEIAAALSFALRYQGRKRVFDADDVMAQITAERLVQHLEASGFVVMKGTAWRLGVCAPMR
jgi:hypothetical protein